MLNHGFARLGVLVCDGIWTVTVRIERAHEDTVVIMRPNVFRWNAHPLFVHDADDVVFGDGAFFTDGFFPLMKQGVIQRI